MFDVEDSNRENERKGKTFVRTVTHMTSEGEKSVGDAAMETALMSGRRSTMGRRSHQMSR
jgi:hypothetical protein